MIIARREFLKLSGLAMTAAVPACNGDPIPTPKEWRKPADYTIHIAPGLVELAPDRIIATTLYNSQFPGPLIRLREDEPATIDLFNDTDTPEQLHWHGQHVPVDVDGSAEEGTPFIPAYGHRRVTFTPGPSGVRFYHTHNRAGPDLRAGQYGGQVGIVYIEPKSDPGAYDREVFLMLKEFEPVLSRNGDMPMTFLAPAARDRQLQAVGESATKASLANGIPHGFEISYGAFSINGKMLGHGEPIRVNANERVLFHIVNGSATEIRSLALPGHTFQIVALDGNPVPTPVETPVLWLGTGERVSAIVRMTTSGVWVLGDVGDDRGHGMGIVVEYAGATGKPQWRKAPDVKWNYVPFAHASASSVQPDQTIEMVFTEDNAAANGFNRWRINGVEFSMDTRTPTFTVQRGKHYRVRMRNASDDIHPMHLHRHTFEVTKVAGHAVSGLMKDVVMVGEYQEVEIDFTADRLGLSLFHCHMQLHMDYGLMALFDCR
jgi:FtsP/CotA-like multicopper oxidase with cupredoxin domain